MSSQRPLGTAHLPFHTRGPLGRHPARQGQGLKSALGPVVIILPPEHVNMQRHPGRKRPAPKTVMHHLRVQGAHHVSPEPKIANEKGPGTDIQHRSREGLVEGRVRETIPRDALPRPQGLLEARAQRDQRVFRGVVVVDRQVAFAPHEERPTRMLRPGVQHVVQEADTRPDPDVLRAGELGRVVGRVEVGDGGFVIEDCASGGERGEAAAVEGEGDLDVGFVGLTF